MGFQTWSKLNCEYLFSASFLRACSIIRTNGVEYRREYDDETRKINDASNYFSDYFYLFIYLSFMTFFNQIYVLPFKVDGKYGLYNDTICDSKTILDFLTYLRDSNWAFLPRYRLLFGAFQSKFAFSFLMYVLTFIELNLCAAYHIILRIPNPECQILYLTILL